MCAEGSRAANAADGGLKHSNYSASLAEALYGSVAQTLSFLCAVAPEVRHFVAALCQQSGD